MILYYYACTIFFTVSCGSLPLDKEYATNVGTILFSVSDIHKNQWGKSEIGLLQARRYFQNLLPPPIFINTFNEDHVNILLGYFKDAYSAIKKEAKDPETDTIMTTALSDAIGGYLKVWVLPVAKLDYYGGTISQSNVVKLFQFYNEIKRYLDTNGDGWRKPDEKILNSVTINVAPLQLVSNTRSMKDPCDHLAYFEKTSTGLSIPTPNVNWNDKSSTMFVPLKNVSIISMNTPDTSQSLIKYYNAARSCIQTSDPKQQERFDVKFQKWLVEDVVPHLKDENLYLALGSVLTLVNRTQDLCNNVLDLYLTDKGKPKKKPKIIIPCDISSKKMCILTLILIIELAWCVPALIFVLCLKRFQKKDCSSNVYLFIDNDKKDKDKGASKTNCCGEAKTSCYETTCSACLENTPGGTQIVRKTVYSNIEFIGQCPSSQKTITPGTGTVPCRKICAKPCFDRDRATIETKTPEMCDASKKSSLSKFSSTQLCNSTQMMALTSQETCGSKRSGICSTSSRMMERLSRGANIPPVVDVPSRSKKRWGKRSDDCLRKPNERRQFEDSIKLEERRQAEERRKLQERRQTEECRKLEERRQAEECRKLEERRQAEECRKLEERRQAEECRKLEERTQAEESKKLEERRQAEESKKLEERRQAEACRRLGERTQADECKKLEERRQVEACRRLEEWRQSEEGRQPEQSKKSEERRKLDERRQVEECGILEERKMLEECRKLRQLDECRKSDDGRKFDGLIKLDDLRILDELRQLDDLRKLDELRKIDDCRKLQDRKIRDECKKFEDRKKLEECRKLDENETEVDECKKLEERRKLDECRRRKKAELCKQTAGKQKLDECRKLEELQKLECQKLEELRKLDECRKLEELRQLDECRKLEELRKLDECRKLEELRKFDECRQLEERRKLDECLKLEERRKLDECTEVGQCLDIDSCLDFDERREYKECSEFDERGEYKECTEFDERSKRNDNLIYDGSCLNADASCIVTEVKYENLGTERDNADDCNDDNAYDEPPMMYRRESPTQETLCQAICPCTGCVNPSSIHSNLTCCVKSLSAMQCPSDKQVDTKTSRFKVKKELKTKGAKGDSKLFSGKPYLEITIDRPGTEICVDMTQCRTHSLPYRPSKIPKPATCSIISGRQSTCFSPGDKHKSLIPQLKKKTADDLDLESCHCSKSAESKLNGSF